jgi:hypothetical protein
MYVQVMQYFFTWLGQKYLWHIPQREAEYTADSLQPKEITFPDLEKQAQQKNMMNLETASESFKHRFLDAHRSIAPFNSIQTTDAGFPDLIFLCV